MANVGACALLFGEAVPVIYDFQTETANASCVGRPTDSVSELDFVLNPDFPTRMSEMFGRAISRSSSRGSNDKNTGARMLKK